MFAWNFGSPKWTKTDKKLDTSFKSVSGFSLTVAFTSSIKVLHDSFLSKEKISKWKFLSFAKSLEILWQVENAKNFHCLCDFANVLMTFQSSIEKKHFFRYCSNFFHHKLKNTVVQKTGNETRNFNFSYNFSNEKFFSYVGSYISTFISTFISTSIWRNLSQSICNDQIDILGGFVLVKNLLIFWRSSRQSQKYTFFFQTSWFLFDKKR